MLIIMKNGSFIADAQNEEKVKGLCKKFFDEDDAHILGNVNTLSEEISRLPDRHFGANVNTPNVNFFCAMDLHADIVEKLEEMELCYHYAMKEYPISELVRITRRYAKLRNAFRTLDKGSEFNPSHIKRILKSKLYCGYIVGGGVSSPKLEEITIIDKT